MKMLVIACRVLKNELLAVDAPGACFEFLEQGLHRTPNKMPQAIQEIIHQAGDDIDYILLGYGACGSGILGVKAGKQPVVIPRAHDCISFWLGSAEAHRKEHEKAPGTYYLNKGWIDEAKSPLGSFAEYTERYGRETAEWVISEMFKNYTRVALVDTGTYDPAVYREHARANAAFLKVDYEEIKGSLSLFKKMVGGKWSEDDFIILQPGEEVTQEIFLSLIGGGSNLPAR
ncbi:MAG: hypothetical protein CL874_01115 [Dehalococcoidales bacterium]|jgi:hypothetical protein|nr:hypothetical protein [Dehalococcoidales bacterium]MDP6448971.1 DUF1638 domain-containing protein [Dehalococcoidales bacterium]MDP6576972.1 DUF1638 domain-containing protein [Dehalococcoidales bacterium]